jgi:nucleoid-associated protein YgaU
MALFGKSLEEKVQEALGKIRPQFPGTKINADLAGKIVTLKGEAPDVATKGRIMAAFNALVETENTINQISIPKPAAPAPAEQFGPPAPAPAAGRIHEVVKGDTLSAIAKKYYGNAGKYMKIFEANRDILDNPDLIKVGQKLKIPD